MYCKWANSANFTLMLPRDVKKWKEAAEEVMRTLDHDLRERPPYEQAIHYLDKLFRQLAVEWLVAMNQVGIHPYN
jgi:hypothetical protein